MYRYSFVTHLSCEIFIPELSLAFEYNGEYHYKQIPVYQSRSSLIYFARHDEYVTVQRRDKIKQMVCESNGITLIVIPFWWNKTIESVLHSIRAVRPDILLPATLLKGKPIPSEMPIQRPTPQGRSTE